MATRDEPSLLLAVALINNNIVQEDCAKKPGPAVVEWSANNVASGNPTLGEVDSHVLLYTNHEHDLPRTEVP